MATRFASDPRAPTAAPAAIPLHRRTGGEEGRRGGRSKIMSAESQHALTQQLVARKASRRAVVAGAVGLGLSAGAAGAAPSTSQTTTPGTYPLTTETVTFRVMVPSNAFVEDFVENEFTAWYEEKTNVHLEWEIVPETEAQSKFNTVLASGDLPDIFMTFRPSPSLQQLYGSQGVFQPLNDLIEQYGVQTKAMFAEYPEAQTGITATDGNIYALPQLNDCFHCALSQKMWIYQPWLDGLGLSMPQTTDEFAQVLAAFKEQDPNGDGQADELPLSSGMSWQTDLDLFLMNSFIYDPGGDRLILRDGVVTASYAQPEWREGLRYVRRLFADGLIGPEVFTQDWNQMLLATSKEPPVVGAAPAGAYGAFIDTSDPEGRWSEYVTVPPLMGPQGVRIAAYAPYFKVIGGDFIITQACQQPEIAFRWADGLYERETTMRSVHGVPGTDWRWAEPGEVGVNGEPAIWADLGSAFGLSDRSWRQTGPSYRPFDLFHGGAVVSEGPNGEVNLYNETNEKYAPYAQPVDWALPTLYFSPDQSQQIAEQAATINPYVMQAFAQFATGALDVEADWETYLDTLEGMGLSQYLALYQEVYDSRA
jgi:putative aldouronate transport system substrate-binding protein